MNNITNPTVIVGGGFVGLFTALHLSHRHYSEPIILIDSQDRFVFKPLLYEHLTGEMQNEQVLPRYEKLLEGSKVTFIQDKVTKIDLKQRRLELASGLHYDYRHLVLGVGSTQGYLGTEGAEENAFAFRTQEDTIALEKHLRECLQQASQAESAQREALLTIAIVGAGPSGVEIAATLADLLPQWYEKLGGDFSNIRIVLVNHGQEILKGDVNSHLRDTALKALKDKAIPVELVLGAKVTKVGRDRLEYQLENEESTKTISTQTVVWTAGTANNPLLKTLSIADKNRDRHGLPMVTDTLQLPNYPEVFAAGDCAVVLDRSYPPVAQIAYQEGKTIAKNLMALSQNKELHPVNASMRGTLMKLGIRNGVANIFDKVKVKGRAGDSIRSLTYLEMLPTPIHNFNATTEWLSDEIFHDHHHYHQPTKLGQPKSNKRFAGLASIAAGAIAAVALVGGTAAVWHIAHSGNQPQATQKQLTK